MSQSSSFDFTKFVPGFDFLKQLSQSNASLPQAHQWVAPTVDPQEIEKRIQELKTVHFWLEQNTKAVLATVQALEVQLMTINTLKGMNMSLAEMAKGLQIKPKGQDKGVDEKMQDPKTVKRNYFSQSTEAHTDQKEASALQESTSPEPSARDSLSVGEASQAVDPMAWWGALSQQFSQIANQTFTEIQKNAAAVAKANEGAKERTKTSAKSSARSSTRSSAQTNSPAKSKEPPKSPAAHQRTAPVLAKGARKTGSSKTVPLKKQSSVDVAKTKTKTKTKDKPKPKAKAKAKAKAPISTPQKPSSAQGVKDLKAVHRSKPALELKTQDRMVLASPPGRRVKSSDQANLASSTKSWFSSPPPLTPLTRLNRLSTSSKK